jgi:hypothetical protein
MSFTKEERWKKIDWTRSWQGSEWSASQMASARLRKGKARAVSADSRNVLSSISFDRNESHFGNLHGKYSVLKTCACLNFRPSRGNFSRAPPCHS